MKDLMAALKLGTTRPVAFSLGLMCVMQAMSFWIGTWTWLNDEAFKVLLNAFDYNTWAGFYAISGLLIVWRVMSDDSRPKIAWAVNAWTAIIWVFPVFLRFVYIGWETLFSIYTIIALQAGWILYRTEATVRDTRVA